MLDNLPVVLDFFPWRDVVFPFVSFDVDRDACGDPVRVSDVWQSFVAGGCDVEIELGTEVEVCDAETTDGTEGPGKAPPSPSLPSLLVWDLVWDLLPP